MNCPLCDGQTRVMETRSENLITYRRHKCVECDYLFYTKEECINDNSVKDRITNIVKRIYKTF